MSERAFSVAFFDPAADLHGSLRSGLGAIFRAGSPEILDPPAQLTGDGKRWHAEAADVLSLDFEAVTPPARLAGTEARVCRVRGEAGGRVVDCLGTASATSRPPAWAELDATRAISAVFDAQHALLAFARRPRGARGHGEERVEAWLIEDGELRTIEDARLSTLYDGEGRQRGAGLELWRPGEDLPRRASGEAHAGVSFALEGLHVHAAVFSWRMDGREGAGGYELTVREDPVAAA